MKILLLGEASYLHNTLKKGLLKRGHRVVLASDGNNWHNSPRDIDLRRNIKRWGKISGLMVLWKIFTHLSTFCGNDIVQVHNYQFVPLMPFWNKWIFKLLKMTNQKIVKGCWGDDVQIFNMQAKGVPAYSDTFWNGHLQNIEANRERIAEQMIPSFLDCWQYVSFHADALVPCLYEYYQCYHTPDFQGKLHYISLPMEMPVDEKLVIKGKDDVIKVLVGLQPKREFLKGALKIAQFVETVAKRHPGKMDIKYVEGVPYEEYCRMIDESDVLVDQFYSYTPSMNSLAAMARGTVVIGGGEEDYYRFIGEKKLRPIINVSPEYSDDENVAIIEKAFFTVGNLAELSRQSVDFVKKYHDYRKVAAEYEELYDTLLSLHE